MRILFQGRLLDADSLQKDPEFLQLKTSITVAGVGLPDEEMGYTFKGEEEFEDWVGKQQVNEIAKNIAGQVRDLLQRRSEIEQQVDDVWQKNIKASDSLRELSRNIKEPISSKTLLESWIKKNSDKKTIDPFLGYDEVNFKGNWVFPAYTSPVMGTFNGVNWNDRLSSIKMIAASGMFCEHTWYGGAKLWLFGFPFANFKNLGDFIISPGRTWNRQISSYALFSG